MTSREAESPAAHSNSILAARKRGHFNRTSEVNCSTADPHHSCEEAARTLSGVRHISRGVEFAP